MLDKFSRKSCRMIVWENIVEWGRTSVTIWRMRIACWITMATNTHSEYVIRLFHDNSDYANALQCYVIRILPVLFAQWRS